MLGVVRFQSIQQRVWQFQRSLFSAGLGLNRVPTLIDARRAVSSISFTSTNHQYAMSESYMFGPWPIDDGEIFAKTSLSFAFVNLKPIVPGHVLVSTKRVVPRFTDLTPEETQDVWNLAQKVGQMLEKYHGASSLTLTIQDGPAAGQTVPHVHVHILPRKDGDFEPNDIVYDEVDASSKDYVLEKKQNLDEARPARTPEEMAAEALEYRKYFST